ncbi:hypothetical protein CDAR_183431 [Caerostris darwini]|uniref:Uncharacterized protein n=1 Tax=Caerostris darwini TaxID=1538125 RepID=A0AAV4RJG4_9ARAC|nr:hypothetical protein CDAR_183431 [Caerostris darwini]
MFTDTVCRMRKKKEKRMIIMECNKGMRIQPRMFFGTRRSSLHLEITSSSLYQDYTIRSRIPIRVKGFSPFTSSLLSVVLGSIGNQPVKRYVIKLF